MESRPCPKCGSFNRHYSKFCANCKTSLVTMNNPGVCSQGHRLDPTWKECPFCKNSPLAGPPIPAQAQAPRQKLVRGRTMVELPDETPAQGNTPAPDLLPLAETTPTRLGKRTLVEEPSETPSIAGTLVTWSHRDSGMAYLIREGRNVIGTYPGAEIRIDDPTVSNKHAVILVEEGHYFIDDSLSAAGTFVNGSKIKEKHRLNSGDIIKTGKTIWRFVKIEKPAAE